MSVPFYFRQARLLYCDAMLKQVLEQGRKATPESSNRAYLFPSESTPV